jgi:hypothetical protein
MKVKCLKLKKWVTCVVKMCKKCPNPNNSNLKWGTCHNGCLKRYSVILNLEDQNNTLIKTKISYGLFVSLQKGMGSHWPSCIH